MLCEECGSEMVESIGPITETYRGEQVTVTGVNHLECPRCGNASFNAIELDEYSDALETACKRQITTK